MARLGSTIDRDVLGEYNKLKDHLSDTRHPRCSHTDRLLREFCVRDWFRSVSALFVNGAVGGFTADLLISSFVFWAAMFSNSEDGSKPWAFIVLNLCIGLSCALPAYLWAWTRATSEISEAR